MSLAERGNEAAVSITTGECQKELNEPSYFDKFPPNAVLHAFGNTLKPDFKGSYKFRLVSIAVGRDNFLNPSVL